MRLVLIPLGFGSLELGFSRKPLGGSLEEGFLVSFQQGWLKKSLPVGDDIEELLKDTRILLQEILSNNHHFKEMLLKNFMIVGGAHQGWGWLGF